MGFFRSLCICLFIAALANLGFTAERRPVRVVYYYPYDRPPIHDFRARLDKVMRCVQDFYRREMDRNGWGPETFDLDRKDDGSLAVNLVKGTLPLEGHGRNKGVDQMNKDVNDQLRLAGIDASRETLVIFTDLLVWQDGVATEHGPYYGSGSPNSGRCWVMDDDRLDPDSLSSKEPGGWYGRPVSIGEFNSHYIGGVAHELGHGFGLPHEGPTPTERRELGDSLMGAGNHTFGRELRGEGKGTYLSAAAAMILARHPRFRPEGGVADGDRFARLDTFTLRQDDDSLTLSGVLETASPALGVVAYSDKGNNYEAYTSAAAVGKDGRFQVSVLSAAGPICNFRLSVCLQNGLTTELINSPYRRTQTGEIRRERLVSLLAWTGLSRWVEHRENDKIRALLKDIESGFADMETIKQQCQIARGWLDPGPLRDAVTIRAEERSVAVSDLTFSEAKVGWGHLTRDRTEFGLDGWPFLSSGSQTYSKGLAAHAASRILIPIGGMWQTFQSWIGMQDGGRGNVIYIVRGDGRELYRSSPIRDGTARFIDLPIHNVQTLELITEDASSGNAGDWSLWLDPVLKR